MVSQVIYSVNTASVNSVVHSQSIYYCIGLLWLYMLACTVL